MPTVLERQVSVSEYLESERVSEERHEYVNGELRSMAGESLDHE